MPEPDMQPIESAMAEMAEYEEPSQQPRRLITTFYSFKGGVGRTMAMQGAAVALAQRRQSVLLVDADMEAPGLTLAYLDDEDANTDGFADIAAHVSHEVRAAINAGRVLPDKFDLQIARRMTDALIPIYPGRHEFADESTQERPPQSHLESRLAEIADEEDLTFPPPGTAYLLPVGRVLDDYGAILRKLRLNRLFPPSEPYAPPQMLPQLSLKEDSGHELSAADVFAIVLQRALLQVEYTLASDNATHRFDHIFIDSRTGLADVAGVCVHWLADRLVAVAGLNEQNIEGTRKVLEDYAEVDPADTEKVTLAIGPVPTGELRLLDDRIQVLRERLDLPEDYDPILLHYEPRLALSEAPLIEPCHRHSQLHDDYLELAAEVETRAGFGSDAEAQRVLRAAQEGEYPALTQSLARLALTHTERAREIVRPMLEMLRRGEPTPDATVPLEIASMLLGGEADSHEAIGSAFFHLGTRAFRERGKAIGRKFYAAAPHVFERLTEIAPEDERLWNGWGAALFYRGQLVQCEEPKHLLSVAELYAEACEKYERASNIDAEQSNLWNDWGVTLAEWGQALQHDDPDCALQLYEQACQKYRRATDIDSENFRAWNNWATALIGTYHVSGDECFLDNAREKVEAMPGNRSAGATYNLACIEALSGNHDQAFDLLEETVSEDYIDWDHVSGDADWDELRDHSRYKELEAKFGGEEDTP